MPERTFPTFVVVIPTLNAARDWPKFTLALLACASPSQVLVLDSSSTDGTAEMALASGFRVHTIPRAEFDHGGTRQFGVEMLADAEVVVYLTQDAVLVDADSLHHLL